MYIGNKNRINVSSSQFAEFIENDNLYVDKTAFIEHVLQDASSVLLFTRPRRMGKSLNLNTHIRARADVVRIRITRCDADF